MTQDAVSKPVYPFPTELVPDADGRGVGGWSIFLLNLRQRVYPRDGPRPRFLQRRRVRRHGAAWGEILAKCGWQLHPYLCHPHGDRIEDRDFSPVDALCPSTHDALFGAAASFPPRPIAGRRARAAAICRRLDRRDAQSPNQQPLLLTRVRTVGDWLGEDLELRLNRRGTGGSGDGSGSCRRLGFRIEWADLWLFPDGHGPDLLSNAMLAFKVVPLRMGDRARPYRVGGLAELNRALRDLDLGPRGSALVRPAGTEMQREDNLWRRLLSHWLGVDLDADGRMAGPPETLARGSDNALMLQRGDLVLADRYSDYAKVLTAARIAPPGEGPGQTGGPGDEARVRAWEMPLTTPAPDPARIAAEQAQGRWSAEQGAQAQGLADGYPTIGDALLYELASTSSEGSALGLDGSRGYRVSVEYLRRLCGESTIDIWDSWKGLAIRDCCAFLAWDPSVPIVRQAEQRYYPLYLHSYYAQLRLHDFAESIVEHELSDLRRAREIRHAFTQFRNQFWFREPATRFQGIEVADAMRAGMGLDGLYESVAAEVELVGNYVDQKAAAGRQQLIALLIFLLWPAAFLWTARSDELEAWVDTLALWQTVGLGCGLLVVTLLLYALLAERVGRWLRLAGDWLRWRGL